MTALNATWPVYEFDSFRLDPTERLLFCKGVRLSLSPKAFEALVLLVENSGRVVSKEEFFAKIWPNAFVEDGSLTVLISMIRKVLGEGKDQPRYIETVSKLGYRFLAEVKVATLADDKKKAQQVLSASVASAAPVPGDLHSIAVLPFKALSQSTSNQFLQMGLADAIITRLSNIRRFIVRPTSAVARYELARPESLVAGRELGVDYVLDGYVRQTQERIRVTVQLIRTADGSPIWAERFDEEFTDIFTVEDSISERVAMTLLDHLSGEEKTRLSRHYTVNTEAYQAYLKGRYFWNKRTKKEIKKAVEYFEQALELDDGLALACVGLADAYALYSTYGIAAPREAYPLAEKAALRALELDGQLAEAHASLGLIKYEYHWDWKSGERELARALELKPNYATAFHWYAGLLVAQGQFAKGLQAIRRARELDPLSLIIRAKIAWYYYFARQYDLALQEVTEALEMDQSFGVSYLLLAFIYERMNLSDAAIAAARSALNLMDESSLSLGALIQTLTAARQYTEAQELLNRLDQLSERQFVSPYERAMIDVSQSQHDSALAWLDKAVEVRDPWLIWLNVEPRFDPLRPYPRFAQLQAQIGLSPGHNSSRL